MKKILKIVGVLFLVLFAGSCVALLTIEHWFFAVTNPGAFDPTKAPPVPDYRASSSWAALPSMQDDADVSLPSLPAIDQESAAVDVFFVHPTTALGSSWNAPIDDPTINTATARGATLIQASAFNVCCAIYAPRYRQANGIAFTVPSDDGSLALDVAYQDVAAAFRVFVAEHNKGRPFILASHSQGTFLATRLLREEIAGKALQERLVAAYLIGGPIHLKDIGGVPVCSSAQETGCVVAWNARGPLSRESVFEFGDPTNKNEASKIKGRICVNPLSWRSDEVTVSADKHEGALFFDAREPAVLPSFSDAKCEDGKLITNIAELPSRGVMSGILMWVMGPENYHPIEYQLFYVNLRNNASLRAGTGVSSQ
jgi:pimeloyl-ACP methyl ester carboxylesterase